MKNVKMTTKGTKLLLEIDLSEDGQISASEKSLVIASTNGNIPVPGVPGLSIGVNLFTPNPDYDEAEAAKRIEAKKKAKMRRAA